MSDEVQSGAWSGGRPPLAWLEKINRQALVGRLLVSTVHDVNNTLQVISGAAEVLAMDPTPAAVERRTTSIVAQAHHATAGLQALTAFARDVGEFSPRLGLKAVADQAVHLRQQALRKARIAVSVTGEEAECAATPGRVLQVLLNVLVNAEQALDGRPGATLLVQVAAEPDTASVTVEDNGPGLDQARAASLFTWPPPAPAAGALGIGLIVSRALAARDGGTLTHEPLAHGGALFRLSLPRHGGAHSSTE